MNQIIETQSTGPNVAELERIVGEALEESRRSGASSAEAGVSVSTGLSVNVRLGEVEKIEHTRDRGLGVTVYLGHKKGSASTTDFSDDAVRETVQAACGLARYTAEDECGGLADPQRMATEIPDLDLYHPWELSAEQAIELALTSENAARSFDERITNSDGASVSHQEGEHGVRQHPRLSRWISQHPTWDLLLGHRRRRRWHADRLLVQRRASRRRAPGPG